MKYTKMFLHAFFVSVLCAVSCGPPDYVQPEGYLDYEATQFFVVAHPDDWQLFMGQDAYDLMRHEHTRTVLVVLTSGDAGRDDAFWQARENASKASVRAAYSMDVFAPSAEETDGFFTTQEKKVYYTALRNTTIYFFRLPDGMPRGGGSPKNHHQSLLRLMEGTVDRLDNVDRTYSFTYEELQRALQDIVEYESGDKVSFFLMDSGSRGSMGHSDHFVSRALTVSVLTRMGFASCRRLDFEDYRISKKPENLNEDEAGKKILLFSAYDMFMTQAKQGCSFCSKSHISWLFRSYRHIRSCAAE